MKKIDYGTLIVFIAALFVISFFWKCEFDSTVTMIALVIAAITGFATHAQYKKIQELSGTGKEKQ